VPEEYTPPPPPKMKVTGPVMAALFTPPLVLATSVGIWYAFFREGPVKTDLGGDDASEVADSDFE